MHSPLWFALRARPSFSAPTVFLGQRMLPARAKGRCFVDVGADGAFSNGTWTVNGPSGDSAQRLFHYERCGTARTDPTIVQTIARAKPS